MLSNNDIAYLSRKKEELVNNCPLCKGRKAFCKCQYAFQFEFTKVRANIPAAVRDFNPDNITFSRLSTIKDFTKKYATLYATGNSVPNLIVSGTDVTVTNGLAAYILMEALRVKRTGYYFTSLLDAKTAAAKNWSAKDKKEIDCIALNTYDIIVIAGFGTDTETSSAAYEELKEIVKTRGANGLITLFVSRKSFANLPEQEKAIIGACRASEMACYNWGVSDMVTPSEGYFIPEEVVSTQVEQKQEVARAKQEEKHNKRIQGELDPEVAKYLSYLQGKRNSEKKKKQAARKKKAAEKKKK